MGQEAIRLIGQRRSSSGELRRVYREHVDAVFAYFAATLDRHTAEDLTASTFERVVRGWDSYDPTPGLERRWILTIARNVLMDHHRRRRTRNAVSLDEHEGLLDTRAVEPDCADQCVTRAELRSWLAGLPVREREVLALRYGADLTAADAAAVLGLSADNVHQIASRSLRRLRDRLEHVTDNGSRVA